MKVPKNVKLALLGIVASLIVLVDFKMFFMSFMADLVLVAMLAIVYQFFRTEEETD